MRHLVNKWSVAVAAVVAVVVATTAAVALANGRGNSTDTSSADVVFFSEPDTAVGHSKLQRKNHEVRMTFTASQLLDREAVTIWWVVFNRPENCLAPGCNEEDIYIDGDPTGELNVEQIEATDLVVAFADGRVSNPAGRATFRASLHAGEPGHDQILGEGAVLKDTRRAEIHLVSRSHGPAIDGLVDEQISSFDGGCEVDLIPPDRPTQEGECGDLQFAVHAP